MLISKYIHNFSTWVICSPNKNCKICRMHVGYNWPQLCTRNLDVWNSEHCSRFYTTTLLRMNIKWINNRFQYLSICRWLSQVSVDTIEVNTQKQSHKESSSSQLLPKYSVNSWDSVCCLLQVPSIKSLITIRCPKAYHLCTYQHETERTQFSRPYIMCANDNTCTTKRSPGERCPAVSPTGHQHTLVMNTTTMPPFPAPLHMQQVLIPVSAPDWNAATCAHPV